MTVEAQPRARRTGQLRDEKLFSLAGMFLETVAVEVSEAKQSLEWSKLRATIYVMAHGPHGD